MLDTLFKTFFLQHGHPLNVGWNNKDFQRHWLLIHAGPQLAVKKELYP